MSREGQVPQEPERLPSLKLPEARINAELPWSDDLLDRMQTAEMLTGLVRNQTESFVVGMHGHWGTGKTFLLKRWQADLANQEFEAIYFNAWEDDFCDDPLVAILGQLSEHFKEDDLKSVAEKVKDAALSLVWQNLRGVLAKHTGLTLVLPQDENIPQDPLESYISQRATKERLKGRLAELSAKVREKSGQPLVFIIDELDRCRPTFAIELLERVKHVFDVPNLVFVFGINRTELCASLQSVYGAIEADTYLRRFFDMELTLREVVPEKFARHLLQRFGLSEYFRVLSSKVKNRLHRDEFDVLTEMLPLLWGHLGLSLRDIDYCVRCLALAARNLQPRRYMFPWLLGLLITLKLKNRSLYTRFTEGNCLASEVMNYIWELIPPQKMDRRLERVLNTVEGFLYKAEVSYEDLGKPNALSQLMLLQSGEKMTNPDYVSNRVTEERSADLIRIIQSEGDWTYSSSVPHYLASLIDLHPVPLGR